MTLNNSDFNYIRDLVYRRASIVLEEKKYLVESRLEKLIQQEGIHSVSELVARLQTRPHGQLHTQVIEAMTTTETSFFRDGHPFEALQKFVLPELLTKRRDKRRLNLWSAACSSGQEPYSIAMLLHEHFPYLTTWTVQFIASDLSTEMLMRARQGQYRQSEINRGLPAPFLTKYFQESEKKWELRADIRQMVEFREINLTNELPRLPNMDIIFMRNVLIYFDVATKKRILDEIRRVLKPDGYLFLGSAETTMNLDDAFEKVKFDKAVCYRLC